MIILLEEELVAVDLTNSDWRTIPLPYLISLHSSAVTFLTYVDDVSEDVWDTLLSIGQKQAQESHSSLVCLVFKSCLFNSSWHFWISLLTFLHYYSVSKADIDFFEEI